MTASYLVAIAVTDPSSGRVWTAPTGSSHYDLMVIAARELGDDRRLVEGFLTDDGTFLDPVSAGILDLHPSPPGGF
jgi:hypothetical protein